MIPTLQPLSSPGGWHGQLRSLSETCWWLPPNPTQEYPPTTWKSSDRPIGSAPHDPPRTAQNKKNCSSETCTPSAIQLHGCPVRQHDTESSFQTAGQRTREGETELDRHKRPNPQVWTCPPSPTVSHLPKVHAVGNELVSEWFRAQPI